MTSELVPVFCLLSLFSLRLFVRGWVKSQRRQRVTSEAAEIKARWRRQREHKNSIIVETALDVVVDVVCEAALRSAIARVEQIASQEVSTKSSSHVHFRRRGVLGRY